MAPRDVFGEGEVLAVTQGVGPPSGTAGSGSTYYERDLSGNVVAVWLAEEGDWGLALGPGINHVGEQLGYASSAVQYATDSSGASPQNGIPSMTTGEVEVPASGKLFVEAYTFYLSPAVAGAAFQLYVTEHEVIDGVADPAGEWVAGAWFRASTAGYGAPINPRSHLTRTPGSLYVYKLNVSRVVGSGAVTVFGNAGWPMWLAIESR